MRKPGASVEETFRNVRAAVRKESAGRQIPWESTSLESHFAFHAAPPPKVAKAPSTVPASAPGKPRSVAPSAPPSLALGDTWTYRVRDLLGQSERSRTMTIQEIRGARCSGRMAPGATCWATSRAPRSTRPGEPFTPSSQLYVFPLNPGAKFSLSTVEAMEDQSKSWDHEIAFTVVGEEDVTTLAGTFRAVKLVRTLKWTQRGKPDNVGVNTMTYWYSGQVKRWVLQDQVSVSKSGKETLRQRWELESFSVK
jgi:hypothetical protein